MLVAAPIEEYIACPIVPLGDCIGPTSPCALRDGGAHVVGGSRLGTRLSAHRRFSFLGCSVRGRNKVSSLNFCADHHWNR